MAAVGSSDDLIEFSVTSFQYVYISRFRNILYFASGWEKNIWPSIYKSTRSVIQPKTVNKIPH